MEKGAQRLAEAIIAQTPHRHYQRLWMWMAFHPPQSFKCFARVGSDAIIHMPDRLTEGYGPSEHAVRLLKEQGCTLLLTLDCGVACSRSTGPCGGTRNGTIIVDHHQAGEILPEAYAVIIPIGRMMSPASVISAPQA